MIDRKVVKAPIGPPQAHHQSRLSRVTYMRFLQSKTKPTTTYVGSPLTGAQIDVKYSVEDCGGLQTAFVEISVPLASATVGHNYAHAGLDSIAWEVKCASLLVRITLAVLGFTPEEITRFMEETVVQEAEFSWHTETASLRAKLNAQKRTKLHFDTQYLANGRHDVSVSAIEYREGDLKPGLLVTFKEGNSFRQYGKADHIASRKHKDRKHARMSEEARQHKPQIIGAIKNHVRNETIVVGDTLRLFGLEHPSSWTAESLKRVIAHVWKAAGLAPEQPIGEKLLSPEVEETWRQYQDGEDLREVLPAHTFTRHRDLIKEAKGEDKDIAIRLKARAVRPEGLGYQLCYERRWEPVGDLRKAVLCEQTAPAIIEELERGLAFIQHGEVPAIENAEERGRWLHRWQEYIAREGGSCHGAE